MGVQTVTRLPKIIGELFFGISGNYYLCHYLLEIIGELFFGHFRQFEFLLPVSIFLPETSSKFKNYLGGNFPLFWLSPPRPVFLFLASCCLSPGVNA